MKFSNVKRIGAGEAVSAVCSGGVKRFYLFENGRITMRVLSEGKVSGGSVIYYGKSYAALPGGGALVRKGGGIVYES